jgi:D-serine deaminase-like pyridoxal phosphate-dependent protein
MHVTALPTPQVLVDRSKLLGNIERMQAAADARGVALRPHAKTHKVPAIAAWQVDRGAVGLCCAKVGEAEVFVGAGLDDVRLPYPVHPSNLGRVRALLTRARLSFIVDSLDVARAWSGALHEGGDRADVLVKVDVGFQRCGIDPEGPEAVDMIEAVALLPGLRLTGLLSHAGHAYGAASGGELRAIARREAEILRSLASAARARGIAIDEVSVGSTPTARFSLEEPDITELRPGNYVYLDRSQAALGVASIDDCALTVLARVVSTPARDRLILDCGSKTLSSDQVRGGTKPAGYGAVFTDLESTTVDESLVIERLSEEHATVRVSGASPRRTGDLVRVLPNHACVVSNLVDEIQLVDGLELAETLTVAARGRIA